jgi:hypothetical protein
MFLSAALTVPFFPHPERHNSGSLQVSHPVPAFGGADWKIGPKLVESSQRQCGVFTMPAQTNDSGAALRARRAMPDRSFERMFD